MPHSLRAKLSGLRYKGILEDKDYKRLCKALDNENVLEQIRTKINDCLEALEVGKKFGIFLENEYESKKLVYKQCLDFIDQHMKGGKE